MSWVAVGLQSDVPAGTVVPRRVSQTDLAIWRSAAGTFHAWGDRCPHRGMRLSHGFVRGETLACIYHGWQYDKDGACAYIPAHPDLTPPKTICAASYTCTDKDGLIWVALEDTKEPVPETGGRVPVRTMDVAMSAVALAAQLDMATAPVLTLGGPMDLVLTLQPVDADSCMIHALVGAGHDRKAASRHLEDLRTELEGAT